MMNACLPTKTHGEKSGFKVLAIIKLTEAQRLLIMHALGTGLWELVAEGQAIPSETKKLIQGKLVFSGLLPDWFRWQDD